MTTDIQAVISGIEAILTPAFTTSPYDLHVYTRRPGTIDTPAMIFSLERIEYDVAMSRGADDIMLHGTVFTSMATDRGESQLYDFMRGSGPTSIKAVIENGDETLGGVAQYVVVTGVRAPGIATYGGSQYYAAAFEILVGVAGL